VGREPQIAAVKLLLERAAAGNPYRSLIVTGLRGVGKTVLLNRFEDMAQEADWPTVFKEISGDRSESEDFRLVMALLARQLVLKMDRKKRLGAAAEGLISAIKQLRPKVSLSESGSPEITLSTELSADAESNLSADLTEVLLELGKVAKAHKTGVLILLDEVQNLEKRDLAALIMALHRVSQKGLPVVVIAAGLPNLPKLASQVETYVERLFKMESIGQLDEKAAEAALVDPAKAAGVSYTPSALVEVLRVTGRWPYFIQEWGQKIWDEAPSVVIDSDEVIASTPLVLADLDKGFFQARGARASDRERDYLLAMAELGPGPYIPSVIIERVAHGDAKNWAMQRARLIDKGLIYSPGHNQIDFTVPHFGDYLKRAYGKGRP